jgi:hypothetical protein
MIYFITKHPSHKNQTQFHQITNNYNFSKSQINPNMYKSYIHTIHFYEKKL